MSRAAVYAFAHAFTCFVVILGQFQIASLKNGLGDQHQGMPAAWNYVLAGLWLITGVFWICAGVNSRKDGDQ